MIRGERRHYVGAHLTLRVKRGLEILAKKLHISLSELVYVAVQEKLERSGVDVRELEEDV